MADMAVQSDVMEAAGPYDRARALNAFKLGDVTFYWITRACAISVLLILGGIILSLIAGAWPAIEAVRLLLPVHVALGAVGRSAGARRARSDLRHAGHLRHRDDDRHSGRPRHCDLPDRALSAMAAPPDRHRRRTARRHPLDHLRHVGVLRARPVHGRHVSAVHDRGCSTASRFSARFSPVRRPISACSTPR